jgi:hypothetical protein
MGRNRREIKPYKPECSTLPGRRATSRRFKYWLAIYDLEPTDVVP